MELTLVTETSEVKTQTPGKFPEESTLELQFYLSKIINKYKRNKYAGVLRVWKLDSPLPDTGCVERAFADHSP
jgi:hypothetical protein